MAVELFREFWWLMFPVFGMVMAVWGMAQEDRRQNAILREARAKLERES